MNCPVCNRDNAYTLSICPSCGAMINDSVREELKPIKALLLNPIPKPVDLDLRGKKIVPDKFVAKMQIKPHIKETPKTEHPATEAGSVQSSPTLVEFHNKNATIPEWRLQLKNAVLQRQNRLQKSAETDQPQTINRTTLVTSGANALKAEETPETMPEQIENPTLASALQRIENSRKKFLTESPAEYVPTETKAKPNKTHLYMAAKANEILPKPAGINPPLNHLTGARVSEPVKKADEKPATDKVSSIPKTASFSSSFDRRPVVPFEKEPVISEPFAQETESVETEIRFTEPEPTETEIPLKEPETVEAEDTELQEIDDCAPFAMRFNAGLFDLIIGSFASLLLLTPLMAFGSNWFSVTGLLAFLAVDAIVMFCYLTAAVGLYGRTFGMKLFSLEVVDIEGEEYPTVHQAAVSTSVYLLSLALGGLGFLTVLLNDEKRAAHDLVSRTIVVKEF